jgi:type VI secretion system protein ImpC
MSTPDDDGARGIAVSFGIQTADSPDKEPAAAERPVFRISVVAEAGARPEFSTGPEPTSAPLSITRTAFDQVMLEIGPSLAIEVDNVFDPGGKPLAVDLRFSSFKSFKPQGVVDQVPALRALVDARRVLERVQKGQSVDTARDELARILPAGRFTDALLRDLSGSGAAAIAPATPAASPTGDGLDSLLAKVAFAPASDGGSAAGGRSAATLTEAAARVESAFSALLGSVVEHPEVARLESVWRSLWLLAAEARPESGVEVELVAVSVDGVTKGLTRVAEAAHRGPPDLVVLADVVTATARDIGALERWAEIAESLRAPLVVDAAPGLLGYDSLEDVARSTARISSSNDPRAVLFKSFAAKDSSRWVAVTLNRPLARAAYTADTARIRDISLRGSAGGDRYLYGAFTLAVLAARSFVRFGLGSALTGSEHGRLENLPVHDWDDRGSTCAIPLETFISSETLREIARAGVVALASARNRDAVNVTFAPVVYRGESVARGGDAAAPIGLGDQLFVGRFSYAVEQLAAAIPAGADPATVADTARVVLHGFFQAAPPAGPEIAARVDGSTLEITVRPRRYAGVGLEEVSFAARLGAA